MSTRKIVCVEFSREKAQEMASYCRPAGNERGQDRHPRIHKRVVRAEKISVQAFVVVADEVPGCPSVSAKGLRCVKPEGHKGRCYNAGVFWGEGQPEHKETP